MENKTSNKKYKYYEIKVSIKNTHPPVWRRLQIPAGITYHELNAIIQLAFDWGGYHAYNFEVGAILQGNGIFIELPDLDEVWEDFETKDSRKEKIDKYFEKYKKIKYTYDFGDNWEHDIAVEKIIETDKKLMKPICIKAKMADLPEDCGGPWGYEELLEILADKENERYDDMKNWLDNVVGNWSDDRSQVNMDEINMRLEEYKDHAEFLLGDMI